MRRNTSLHFISTLALVFAFTGCDGPKPEAAPPEAETASAVTSVLPAATAAAPKEEEPAKVIECADGPNADFHDAVLENEIRRKLEKPEGEIKTSELAKVRSLNLARDPGNKTDFLDPCIFPHLKNLKDLFLAPGKLSDISLLSDLTQLEALRVSMNQVKDITPLAKLTKLDRLDLGRTQVEDISPLSELTLLTELQLDGTQIVDVKPLAKLEKLEKLGLERTRVTSVAPLKPLKELEFLYLKDSDVDDAMVVSRTGLSIIED